jgi:hypothetical protein
MTMQEIAQEMMKEIDRYAVTKEVDVPKLIPMKKHKKWRIQKKWLKRFGTKVIYEKKMAKVADITLENVLDFCQEKNLPLPMEFLNNGDMND